ncbi:MAG: hypothetical protein B7X28_09345, partial [Halothiobacillus sp. 13-55-253]
FVGGWSFYLSYELAGQIEPSLDLPRFAPADRVGFPVAVAQYHASALIYDHLHHKTWLVHDGQSADAAESLRACLRAFTLAPQADAALDIHALQADDPARYRSGVQQVLAFLRAGDVFQANLSRAWRFSATQTDAGLRILAWYRLPEGEIISSSPERLVDHRGGQVSTRPIAGTRRRDDDSVRDAALMAELRAHPKERAEHVMLIDLERNDLGRVCQPGSVCVDELMVLESFAHVHHLVSNVCGQLRPDQSVFDLLAATFPGGTITGCPKVRCMEILAELEQTGRGPYTGSVGYLSLDGRMDSNILIRTVFLAKDGLGEFRTGAGIVADSAPERECTETEEKARGLLMALTGGGVAWWPEHFARMSYTCCALGLPLPDEIDVRTAIDSAVAQSGKTQAVIKLMYTAGSGQRGYLRAEPVEPTLAVLIGDVPAAAPEWSIQGLSVGLLKQSGGIPIPALSGLKHLNRLPQVLARAAWPEGVDECLIHDENGLILGGTQSNFFWLENGRWFTPP